MRCLTSGCAKTFLISAFKRATTALGVPDGANRPFQAMTSQLGKPLSATVGNSGAATERCALVTASANSF
jgi:hypothetical protein